MKLMNAKLREDLHQKEEEVNKVVQQHQQEIESLLQDSESRLALLEDLEVTKEKLAKAECFVNETALKRETLQKHDHTHNRQLTHARSAPATVLEDHNNLQELESAKKALEQERKARIHAEGLAKQEIAAATEIEAARMQVEQERDSLRQRIRQLKIDLEKARNNRTSPESVNGEIENGDTENAESFAESFKQEAHKHDFVDSVGVLAQALACLGGVAVAACGGHGRCLGGMLLATATSHLWRCEF